MKKVLFGAVCIAAIFVFAFCGKLKSFKLTEAVSSSSTQQITTTPTIAAEFAARTASPIEAIDPGIQMMTGTWLLAVGMVRNDPDAQDRRQAFSRVTETYTFLSNGTFSISGKWFNSQVASNGTYRLVGRTLLLHFVKDEIDGKPYGRVDESTEVKSENGEYRFQMGNFDFIKGLTWDNAVAQYRFADGNYATGPQNGHVAAPPPELAQQANIDQQVQAAIKREFGDKRPFNIDYWGGDDFRVHGSSDADLAAATQWLKDRHFYQGSGKVFLAGK